MEGRRGGGEERRRGGGEEGRGGGGEEGRGRQYAMLPLNKHARVRILFSV